MWRRDTCARSSQYLYTGIDCVCSVFRICSRALVLSCCPRPVRLCLRRTHRARHSRCVRANRGVMPRRCNSCRPPALPSAVSAASDPSHAPTVTTRGHAHTLPCPVLTWLRVRAAPQCGAHLAKLYNVIIEGVHGPLHTVYTSISSVFYIIVFVFECWCYLPGTVLVKELELDACDGAFAFSMFSCPAGSVEVRYLILCLFILCPRSRRRAL
ncbi:hypothetical protein BJ912DRAFT_973503 [Pholiota molesta]|nr:hypothetical protein BJ912DRAFT_973503 [Pholiota molesta]